MTCHSSPTKRYHEPPKPTRNPPHRSHLHNFAFLKEKNKKTPKQTQKSNTNPQNRTILSHFTNPNPNQQEPKHNPPPCNTLQEKGEAVFFDHTREDFYLSRRSRVNRQRQDEPDHHFQLVCAILKQNRSCCSPDFFAMNNF